MALERQDRLEAAKNPLRASSPQSESSVTSETVVGEALMRLRQADYLAVPMLDSETGEVAAFLVRPSVVAAGLIPPTPRLGGMATPLGVYLTDGVQAGGAGFWGLFLTGMVIGTLTLFAQVLTYGVIPDILRRTGLQSHLNAMPPMASLWMMQVAKIFSVLCVFVLLRIIPMAGTHAAEHQVVHCVEQGAPLVLDRVRSMPRVHPRCGTNLGVGVFLFLFLFVGVFYSAEQERFSITDAATLALVLATPISLRFWRRLGSVIQFRFTTRPATDRQIAGAIRAAEQVLARRRIAVTPFNPRMGFARRVWRMGIAQVALGYYTLLGMLLAIAHFWPGLQRMLEF